MWSLNNVVVIKLQTGSRREREPKHPKVAKHSDVSILKTDTDLNTTTNTEKHTMTKVEENNKSVTGFVLLKTFTKKITLARISL